MLAEGEWDLAAVLRPHAAYLRGAARPDAVPAADAPGAKKERIKNAQGARSGTTAACDSCCLRKTVKWMLSSRIVLNVLLLMLIREQLGKKKEKEKLFISFPVCMCTYISFSDE